MSVITMEATDGGLRELKKARTREALVDAALRLFAEQGFGATTTEEIAAAADVSQRTLFRYFPTKEDIILDVQDETEETFRLKLADRPTAEHPVDSLLAALTATWSELDPQSLNAHLRIMRLADESPKLLAAHLQRSAVNLNLLASLIAHRTGTDTADDPRPELVAAAFGSAVHVGIIRCCRSGDGGVDALIASVNHCLVQLIPALTEPWDTVRPAEACASPRPLGPAPPADGPGTPA
ncbi:TetR/AcrR family transcriptional regulator [Nocardiopsis sediminis]|uniref:TetR/AcrR family transcriptional regulator n=1 Tax=Nocardiopsis sediminis TaxID=1778267 RepID=A0ABV8FL48_9ACTN